MWKEYSFTTDTNPKQESLDTHRYSNTRQANKQAAGKCYSQKVYLQKFKQEKKIGKHT